MSYYTGNGLYDAIANSGSARSFRWATGDSWCLVYGSASGEAGVAVYAEAVVTRELLKEASEASGEFYEILRRLCEAAELPSHHMRFAADRTLTSVALQSNGAFEEIGLDDFATAVFAKAGLDIHVGEVAKEINVQSSSSYHDWQRSSLGGAISVTDIDLIRVAEDLTPVEVLEIKRSFYELDAWSPYQADYTNFRLLGSLAESAGVPATISYHVYTRGSPRTERTNQLSLWRICPSEAPPVQHAGVVEFENFLRGDHLP